MRNRRRNNNNTNSGIINVERVYSFMEDADYFIKKIKNRSKSFEIASYSNENEPEYVQNYLEFIKQYIQFTLTNISSNYDFLADWIKNEPLIRNKIEFIDSNAIGSEVFSYIVAYLDRKLSPSVKSIALSLLGVREGEKVKVNLDTYNIPALAFLGPPGTSKTYSIVSELKRLSQGEGNNIIAGWLHYDITKHEVTTSPLVLPTVSQEVKDDPLPGLALLKTSGDPTLDKALSETVYTKTVNKIVSTFAYILIAGSDKGKISLSREVENTLKERFNLQSIELTLWKFVVSEDLNETNIRQLLDALHELISGFAKVTKALASNKSLIRQDASKLIDTISNIEDDLSKLDETASYTYGFREVARLLHKLITFGLVPVIAALFARFTQNKKLNQEQETGILDGIMYIYNKIHNNYLHRIISTVFLIEALVNTGVEYEQLFENMLGKLVNGLISLLENYYNAAKSSDTFRYLDLEEKVALSNDQTKAFDFYNAFYEFLSNMPVNEEREYILLDKLFMENVLPNLVSVGHATGATAGATEANLSQYRDAKSRQYSDVKFIDAEPDYFSDIKLSFIDHVRLISDTINDLHEIERFYSNTPLNNPEYQESKTTLEKLKSEFGMRFLDFRDLKTSNVKIILSRIFRLINLLKDKYSEDKITFYKKVYEDRYSIELLDAFKQDLIDLFKKSLSVIVNNPRYGYLLEKYGDPQRTGIVLFDLIGDYFLSALDISESLRTKGISYSFPPAVQVFLARAKEAYYKYLRELRAIIAARLKRKDRENVIDDTIRAFRPPLYVLFIDEIMTQLTEDSFTFWLNIWNGLISPANTAVDTYPPNVCFILAGNMPWDPTILGQALVQSGSNTIQNTTTRDPSNPGRRRTISVDTMNALGSRISLKVVTYDYDYLMRTDESVVNKRTALFIRNLAKRFLNTEDEMYFANTAQDLIGGLYDYYKIIVEPRINKLANLRLSEEEKMTLHAYIISLTAESDNIPFNIRNIVPNSIIMHKIEDNYRRAEKKKEVVRKATILNHLFNSKTFGKTIYEYMFGKYFSNNPKEAEYFNAMITIAISPIVLHLSFLHAYLVWNNIMRKLSQQLLRIAENNQDDPKITDAVTELMKVINNVSKIINIKMTTYDTMKAKTTGKTKTSDRLSRSDYGKDYEFVKKYIAEYGDPRYCDPEVGAVISLLSLVFYYYITYMKEFNEGISNSIQTFCNVLEGKIGEIAKTNGAQLEAFNELKLKINNYFVDSEQDIEDREDLIRKATLYEYDLNESVRINLLSFDPTKTERTVEIKGGIIGIKYNNEYYNSITVTLIPDSSDDATGKKLSQEDIKAIKSLVAYTIYTHSLVMKKESEGSLGFSSSLLDNIIVTNETQVPLVGLLATPFFRRTKEGGTFLIEPLRETDRWFTSVTGSIVKYVIIMTILKHVLENKYGNNERNLIKGFLDEIMKSREMTSEVQAEISNILTEFADLLFKAKQAVFTPLATGCKQASNNEYINFHYEPYETSGQKVDGYYTRPNNQVNFGPLPFVFENLKDTNIIQHNDAIGIINTIAQRFLEYLKDKPQGTTTSFFPIHLISHINLKEIERQAEELNRQIKKFSNLSALLYNNENREQITVIAFDNGQNTRHENFYEMQTGKEHSISEIIELLDIRLKNIINQGKAPAIANKLYNLNGMLLNECKMGKNFLELLLKAMGPTDFSMIELKNGVFNVLQNVQKKYPSVFDYVNLWFSPNGKSEISEFFKKLMVTIAQNNADNLSKTVEELDRHLDAYIMDMAKEMQKTVEDINVKRMLEKLSNQNPNNLIAGIISDIMNEGLSEEYIENSDLYRSVQGDKTDWNKRIEYQNVLLKPLIKYALAVILSNIFLVESDSFTFWGSDKKGFYESLKNAIKNSYKRTIDEDDTSDEKEADYLSMMIRYIFFDMNKERDDNEKKKIILSGELIAKTLKNLKANLAFESNVTTSGLHLVVPFYTDYDSDNKSAVESEKKDDKKIITKRTVYTQYIYKESENGIPVLYCDIHHMPIKGIQNVDGTTRKVGPKITIYSSETATLSTNEYRYTDLMFMHSPVIPRYEFAKSAIVNLLLIAGIQEIQQALFDIDSLTERISNSEFASFAITNLYHYYKDEIKQSDGDMRKFIQIAKESRRKILHPLLASIILAFNSNEKDIKVLLEEHYGLGNSNEESGSYSRRDEFINALRLRFYSSAASSINRIEYDMYSIYEPGVCIEWVGNTTQPQQTE